MLTRCRLVDCSLGSQYNLFQALIKLIASYSLDQFTFTDICSDARFNFYKDDFTVLKFYFCFLFASLTPFQMSQSYDRYNLVLEVLIENYRTSFKNKV